MEDVKKQQDSLKYRKYKYRWAILVLYFICIASSGVQWSLFTGVANVVVDFYGVPYYAVNWTGVAFLFWYVVFVYPGTYIIERWGLRKATLFGAFGSCAGAWIKVASAKSDRFWIIILGQSVVAITQSTLTSIPAALAAAWFGPKEVSTACSISILGLPVGVGIGLLLSTMSVNSHPDKDVTEQDFLKLALEVAVTTSVILLLMLIGFRAKPPTPPSRAQFVSTQEVANVTQSLKRLLRNVPFMMFLVAYSCNVGIFLGTCFLMNQILMSVYQNAQLDVGRIGILFIVAGVIGCVIFGAVLDKYQNFKSLTVSLFIIVTVSQAVMSLCIHLGLEVQYVTFGILGFFNNAILPLGLQVAAEITYPEPPSVSSGILLISSKVSGMVVVQIYSMLLSSYDGIWSHLGMSMITLLSAVIVMFTRFDLKRLAVETAPTLTDQKLLA